MYLDNLKSGGFIFDNHVRNKALTEKKVMVAPKATKTGTTIVGVIYKDGVVLAADTRATAGATVADKNCEKIHYIAPNMHCCGAGTAADTEFVTESLASQLELLRFNTGRQSRVSTAVTRLTTHLHRYQGHVGAALILGGFDVKGPQLVSISPWGNCSYLPYCTMGSGSLAATSILEAKFKDDLSLEDAKALVIEAIEAGIVHDEGSGGNVDICVVNAKGSEMFRNIKTDYKRIFTKPGGYDFPKGTTPVIREIKLIIEKVEKMEIE
jgi:20S proteasome subunit beta 2